MGWLQELLRRVRVGPRVAVLFTLRYRIPSHETVIKVGHLSHRDGKWVFWYDDEYKAHDELRPLEGFPDKSKVYESRSLFPFFAVRVPDVDREDVKRRLAEQNIVDPDITDLLRIFGRRIASSPAFELEFQS